ncbi:MFS transporter [Ramlibacter rhizophilus]|uniref:MFS transporter n=1 Tax=Ramlibacter rhizophilus TaxID=1781167 RepID=A0A4Z0BEQ9_9BURK|nr:MFS transporter [Ramlibacter rhizophilus]TFY97300.1 MFS transporter [Ramlibacter rhizophilus]
MSDSLLSYRPFVQLLAARVLAGAATQMTMVAAAWQMYQLTGSALDLGLVGLLQFLPVLVFTLPAGHVADRYHRARVIAAAQSLLLAAAAVLLAASAGGALSRELLFGVSVLLGTARTFQAPAQQSMVPSLVPPSLLARAMAMSSGGNQVAVIGGPALAGLLFLGSGTAVYALAALMLLGAMVAVLRLQDRRVVSTDPPTLHAMLAGVRFVWQRKTLLGAVSLDLMAVLFGGATALLPIFAQDVLHVGPAGLGALRSAPAVGALLVSLALARFPIRVRVGRWLLLSVAAYGVCMLVFGLSTTFWLSLLALALSGGFDMVSVVVRQTLVQMDTPDAMRGRVGAVNSMFIGASNQLGEFESGVTAALLGAVGSVVLGGVATLAIVAAWSRLFPGLAQRQRFEEGG